MACNCGGVVKGQEGSCQCSFEPGLNTSIVGFGSDREPFQIRVAAVHLQGANTVTVKTTVTGSGDVNDPYLLSMNVYQTVALWKRWSGTQDELDALPSINGHTLHAVIP